LKLSRSDDKTHVLLEVELNNGLKLYKHRTVSLTQQHKGHIVNVEWINGFIKTNGDNSIFSETKKTQNIEEKIQRKTYKQIFDTSDSIFCKQCGGDGGLNGRCPRCSGEWFGAY